MSWSNPSAGAAAVVLFLTQECKLKATDAIACAKPLLEAGFDSRDHLLTLGESETGAAALQKISMGHRKKIVKYLKRPAPEAPSPTPKRAKTTGSPEQLEAPPPPEPRMAAEACTATVKVNRSPVMILWAAVVAKIGLGYDWQSSLSLASAVASLNARSKGIAIGTRSAESNLYDPETDPLSVRGIGLLGREAPARRVETDAASSPAPVRGVSEDGVSITPVSVYRYLQNAFQDHFDAAYSAFCILAESIPPEELARKDQGRRAYVLYESFRPDVAGGAAGWGAKGDFELSSVIRLAGAEVKGHSGAVAAKEESKEESVAELIRATLAAKGGETLEALQKLGDPACVQAAIDSMQLGGEAYVQAGVLRPL